MIRAVLVALIGCFLQQPVRAQVNELPVLSGVEQMDETLADTAKVSGRVLSGLGAVGGAAPSKPYAGAWIPDDWKGQIVCLRLVSDDGRYVGSSPYQVPSDWAGGRATLALLSRHVEYLGQTDRERLATLLTKGDCNSDSSEVAVTSWNEIMPAAPAVLRLFVNSFRADEVLLLVEGHKEGLCSRSDSKRMSFDYVCELEWSDLLERETAEIEIVRLRRGGMDRPVSFQLSLH